MEQETGNSTGDGEQKVVHIGNLEDCKYAMDILYEAEIPCSMDVAERVRPEMAHRGYYIVIVATGIHTEARRAIEERLKHDLEIQEREQPEDDLERCPACGAALAVGCATCPECGLCFE